MIIITVMWAILFNRELLSTLWGDAVASIFYIINWWFIFHKLSYFNSFGTPSPLRHLWFLAVQEQFYFLWPIMLIFGLGFFKRRNKLAVAAFIGALCSAILMGIMYNPDLSTSRVYYGTDTRAFELLIGSCLAIILPITKFPLKKISTKYRYMLNIVSVIALAVFILSAIFVDEYQVFIYRGGMLLFSINTALLIICVCHPSGILGKLLAWKPLSWIGTRSYGIYLWHYPIMVLSTPVYEIGNPSYLRVALQLAITCIIAELSYRFIETPIRKLGLRRFYKTYLSVNIFQWRRLTIMKKISAVTVLLVIGILAMGIVSSAKGEQNKVKLKTYPKQTIVSKTEQNATNTSNKTNHIDKNIPFPNKNSNKKLKAKIGPYKQLLTIGDSIMIDISPDLKEKLSNITINGKVGRQMNEAIKLSTFYSGFNNKDSAIIIELGTNGYFTDTQIDKLLSAFSKSHIYLVNTRVPRPWERKVNKILKDTSNKNKNVTLVDWYSTAIKHPGYFGRDGVHLKSTGSEALTDLIIRAINS